MLWFSYTESIIHKQFDILQCPCVWRVDRQFHHKVELKFRSMAHGGLCVVIHLTTVMPVLFVKCLDSVSKFLTTTLVKVNVFCSHNYKGISQYITG